MLFAAFKPVEGMAANCPTMLRRTVDPALCEPGACAATAASTSDGCAILGAFCAQNPDHNTCKSSGITCTPGSSLSFCAGAAGATATPGQTSAGCPQGLTVRSETCVPGACVGKIASGECHILGGYCVKNPNTAVCKNSGVICETNSTLSFCIGSVTGASRANGGDFVFLGLDLAGLDACMSCTLVEMLANTSYELGGKAHAVLQTSMTALLGAIFGIYILVQAGKLLFPFGPLENITGIFNAVATRTLIIIAAMTFMLSFGNYWTLIHTPPLVAGINLTSTLMDRTKITLSGIALINQACPQLDSGDANAIGQAMSCTMRNAQDTVSKGLMAGIGAMFANSASQNPLVMFTSGVGGIVVALLSAAVLLLIYAPIYLSLPLKMADIILRWTLLAVLSPLMIAAAAFPVTRSFMFAGLKGLLQAAFELMLYGIVVAFGAYAMSTIIGSLSRNDGIYATTLNIAMFWQLLLIGWITDVLLAKSRSVAIALTDPTPNPSGMHAGATDELGQQAAARANAAGARTFTWGSNVWQSRKS
jgi:hypothetical protein